MIIINIGDELLIGQVVNTNAAFMGEHLTASGFEIEEVFTIGDNEEQIKQTITESFQKTNVLILTGGLGPTKDDITKKVICDYFKTSLVLHQPTLDFITKAFEFRHIPISDINKQQAFIPEISIQLSNLNGTAPGLWIEQEGKILISMPGVPFEMKDMLLNEALPRLNNALNSGISIICKTVQMTGIGESDLSDLIESWELELPKYIKLAYLPRPGIVRLRLTGKNSDKKLLEAEMENEIRKLEIIAGDYIWSFEDNQPEEVVAGLMHKLKRKLAFAESCTGGYLSHLITSVPGCSDFFKGSIVSYSNEIKREILNVRELNLKKFGAVSEQVVCDMAVNTMDLLDVDYAVAVSGIAGPGGGTAEKPVGTVWIAVATTTRITSKEFHFAGIGGRERVIQRAAVAALNMLRLELLKDLG